MLTLTELMLQRASLGAASCKVIPKKQYKKLLFPCCIYACSYVFYLKIFPRRPLQHQAPPPFARPGNFLYSFCLRLDLCGWLVRLPQTNPVDGGVQCFRHGNRLLHRMVRLRRTAWLRRLQQCTTAVLHGPHLHVLRLALAGAQQCQISIVQSHHAAGREQCQAAHQCQHPGAVIGCLALDVQGLHGLARQSRRAIGP